MQQDLPIRSPPWQGLRVLMPSSLAPSATGEVEPTDDVGPDGNDESTGECSRDIRK